MLNGRELVIFHNMIFYMQYSIVYPSDVLKCGGSIIFHNTIFYMKSWQVYDRILEQRVEMWGDHGISYYDILWRRIGKYTIVYLSDVLKDM